MNLCSCVGGDHLATTRVVRLCLAAGGFSLSRGAASSFPRNESGRRYVSACVTPGVVVVSSSASETPRWARTNGSAWRAESSGGQSRG
jgi:hypothetical protein